MAATTAGPVAAQVKSNAGCPVNDRESPCVPLLTGTWGARPSLSSSPGHLIRSLMVAPKYSYPTAVGSATLVLAVAHVVAMVFLHEDALIRNFVLHGLRGECECS